MISAGEGLAIAARGPHGSLRPGRGDHDLRVRVLEPLSAYYRVIQAAADDAQLRPCSPGYGVPGHGRLPAAQRLAVVPRHALAHIPGPVLIMAIRARPPRSPGSSRDQNSTAGDRRIS
jgi:hypothetical protein